MNYRHAFHAGNFADCMKHALLVWLLRALQRKDTPIAVLDSHAGLGRYDLTADPAVRTGEWQSGIARLLHAPPPALQDYVGLVEQLGLYPGSPVIARALLREQDRLICCELHPDDAAILRRHFRADRQVAVHQRDGYEAIRALLPFPQRRGLILIDPPFERPDEFTRLFTTLQEGLSRFRSGVFAAWYPVKGRAPVRAFHDRLRGSGLRDLVAVELLLRESVDSARLNGCGLLVANPPYGFEESAPILLSALAERLEAEPGHQTATVLRLAAE
jgi:23S rRNA (adenine2030-N6)-methyltransferase